MSCFTVSLIVLTKGFGWSDLCADASMFYVLGFSDEGCALFVSGPLELQVWKGKCCVVVVGCLTVAIRYMYPHGRGVAIVEPYSLFFTELCCYVRELLTNLMKALQCRQETTVYYFQ